MLLEGEDPCFGLEDEAAAANPNPKDEVEGWRNQKVRDSLCRSALLIPCPELLEQLRAQKRCPPADTLQKGAVPTEGTYSEGTEQEPEEELSI